MNHDRNDEIQSNIFFLLSAPKRFSFPLVFLSFISYLFIFSFTHTPQPRINHVFLTLHSKHYSFCFSMEKQRSHLHSSSCSFFLVFVCKPMYKKTRVDIATYQWSCTVHPLALLLRPVVLERWTSPIPKSLCWISSRDPWLSFHRNWIFLKINVQKITNTKHVFWDWLEPLFAFLLCTCLC